VIFNLDSYLAVKRRKLAPELAEFFRWGMELENVADLAPGGLGESYRRMNRLASRVMTQRAQAPRRRPSWLHPVPSNQQAGHGTIANTRAGKPAPAFSLGIVHWPADAGPIYHIAIRNLFDAPSSCFR
jgi:hypothetical protein